MAYQLAMKALGDPTRRAVFESLRTGPRAVGEIARDLPVSRPAVSQHLRALKEAGLVRDRRDGARRLYEVDPEGLGEVRAYLEAFWDEALGNFQRLADSVAARDEGRTGWNRHRRSPRSRKA
jgi:DNA-binding transcriptional ArsR family regulator